MDAITTIRKDKKINEILQVIEEHCKGAPYSKLVEITQRSVMDDTCGYFDAFGEVDRLLFVVKLKELFHELEEIQKAA